MKGSEDMNEMAMNTEYILKLIVELAKKCNTLDELIEAIRLVLGK